MITTDAFSGARVLVTGAGGFIGAHLCRRLRNLGAQVHGTTRLLKADAAPDVQWIATELADEAALTATLCSMKPDVVFHLAGPTSGSRSLEMVLPNLHGNLVTTVNVLRAAAEAGSARIILAGSMEAPRRDEFVVGSPYAAAKQACQLYAQFFAKLHGTAVTLARIFMVYGPGDNAFNRLVPYVMRSLLRGETPRLSSGNRPIDWIYIDDVVEGLLRIALTPGLAEEPVDLGTGGATTVRSLVERIVQITGSDIRPEFGAVPDRPLESVTVADLARTKASLGWEPVTGLDEGLRSTIEYYRRQLADS